jgi:hypothetical protein
MVRVLRNLLAALSLALFLAVAVAWGRSYHAAGPLDDFPDGSLSVRQAPGVVRLVVPLGRRPVGPEIIPFPIKSLGPGESSSWSLGGVATVALQSRTIRLRDIHLDETTARRRLRSAAYDERSAGTRRAGLQWLTGRHSIGSLDTDATPAGTVQHWAAAVMPHPWLLLITGAYPAWWSVRAWRRRRRTQAGLCRACGDDLRATPGRCPECGAEATWAAHAGS